MRERRAIGGLIILTLAVLFLNPTLAWKIQELVRPRAVEPLSELIKENNTLKGELARIAQMSPLLVRGMPAGIPAHVYSRYPFNLKQELLVAAGSKSGVQEGWAAVVPAYSSSTSEKAVFLGRVEKIWDESALLRTIFDPRFQAAVRIGKRGVDGLLIGGVNPKITLIEKQASVHEGDIVLVAAPEFPYGIAVGVAHEARLAKDELFQEATMVPGHDVNSVTSVLLVGSTR